MWENFNRAKTDVATAMSQDTEPTGRRHDLGGRTVTYWIFTVIVAGEMIAGSMWDLLRIEYVRVVLTHLGYHSTCC
jgi:hypothetical protein